MYSFIAWDVPTILALLLFIALIIVVWHKIISKNSISKKDSKDNEQANTNNKLLSAIYFLLFLKTHKQESISNKPKIVQWSISFYPVILLVLVLRSFLAEPFQIPSNSMMPTLLTGDFILVNKFIYGIRLPVINTKIIPISSPKYGDILVFRYPNYEKNNDKKGLDYIKRVIGIPGDEVIYTNDRLIVNNKEVKYQNLANYQGVESGAGMTGFKHKITKLNGVKYQILLHPSHSSKFFAKCTDNIQEQLEKHPYLESHPQAQKCSGKFTMIIPKGYYFVMGDNRSRSADSRFWGFVPEEFILGRAFFIWMHYDDSFKFSRLGVIH